MLKRMRVFFRLKTFRGVKNKCFLQMQGSGAPPPQKKSKLDVKLQFLQSIFLQVLSIRVHVCNITY